MLQWYQNFWITTNRELKGQQRRRQREWRKSNRFISAKQLCMCITHFCAFLSNCYMTATQNFLISCSCVMEYVTTAQKLSVSFLTLDTIFSDNSPPQNVAKIWLILWKWIRLQKFETVQIQIHFSSGIISLLSSREFATMATWRNEFSFLFAQCTVYFCVLYICMCN